jgi:hypothetical protein
LAEGPAIGEASRNIGALMNNRSAAALPAAQRLAALRRKSGGIVAFRSKASRWQQSLQVRAMAA